MPEEKKERETGLAGSVLHALTRIFYGKPRPIPEPPRPPSRPEKVPPSTPSFQERPSEKEEPKIHPLTILRRPYDLRRIYSEAISVNFDRDTRYKDFEDMILDSSVAGAVEMMVDDACQYSREQSASVWVTSDDDKIRKEGEKFFEAIRVEEKMFDWAYNTALYGDFFVKVEAVNGCGIVAVQDDFHPTDVQRIDVNGELVGFRTPRTNYDSTPVQEVSLDLWDPWDWVHFRIQASQRRRRDIERERLYPSTRYEKSEYRLTTKYGVSVLEPVRRVYKQIQMVEQSLIVARLSRALLKYVYQIQVGEAANPKEAVNQVQAIKDILMQSTGLKIGASASFEQQYDPLGGAEDVFLPAFGERGKIQIDKLGGEVDIRGIVDLDYLRSKFFGGLHVPSAYLGFEESFFSGTRVMLLDGSTPTIEEMAKNESSYVGRGILSCHPSGKVHATKILAVRQTSPSRSDGLRIHLDNNEHVDVTPDHLMMLRSGEFVEAKNIKPNDSLMPCYAGVESFGAGKGYRSVKQNVTPCSYDMVYRLVARDILRGGVPLPKEMIVHHLDENKLNDEPSNLRIVARKEHYQYHRDMIERLFLIPGRVNGLKRRSPSEESRRRMSERMMGRPVTWGEKIGKALRGRPKPNQRGSGNVMSDPIARANHLKAVRKARKRDHSNPQWKERWSKNLTASRWDGRRAVRAPHTFVCEVCGKEFSKVLSEASMRSYSPRACSKRCAGILGSRTFKMKCAVNHKVMWVEKLPYSGPTYDLLVESGAHTFPLAAGIFVHNSLPGSLGESALLRLDIRYARTVKRLQRSMIQGLTRLFQIHLAWMNIFPDPSKFSVDMDIISTAEEEERKAALSSALSTANDLARLMSAVGLEPNHKKLGKLLMTEVLGLSGKFAELVDEARDVPMEGREGIGGAVPGEGMMPPGGGIPPEELAPPPPEGGALPTPAEKPEAGVLGGALPTPAAPGEMASTKSKTTSKRVLDAKEQARGAIQSVVHQSNDLRAPGALPKDKKGIKERVKSDENFGTLLKRVIEEDDNREVIKRLQRAAKTINHCGDYGLLYWNPESKKAFWNKGDADVVENGFTSNDDIMKILKVQGVKEAEVESECDPPKDRGWIKIFAKDKPVFERWWSSAS